MGNQEVDSLRGPLILNSKIRVGNAFIAQYEHDVWDADACKSQNAVNAGFVCNNAMQWKIVQCS